MNLNGPINTEKNMQSVTQACHTAFIGFDDYSIISIFLIFIKSMDIAIRVNCKCTISGFNILI